MQGDILCPPTLECVLGVMDERSSWVRGLFVGLFGGGGGV